MKPEDIEEMKRDREAGTPGPWWLHGEMIFGPDDPAVPWEVAEAKADCGHGGCQTEPNARRIARVPTLEAEVLRLREALEECEEYFDNRADAGQPVGSGPIPNVEMELLTTVRAALNGDAT